MVSDGNHLAFGKVIPSPAVEDFVHQVNHAIYDMKVNPLLSSRCYTQDYHGLIVGTLAKRMVTFTRKSHVL